MNKTISTIQKLRTIHGDFSDKKVSDSDLKIILDSAVRAANSSGRQCYSIIVVSGKEKIKQLTDYKGDRLLVFCVDFTRIIDMAEYMGYEFAVNNMLGFITASTDTILAAQTACIAAKSLGIDSLFTQRGFHRRKISEALEVLGLPEKYCFPLVGLILGYPKNEPEFYKGRLTGTGVIHWDKYHLLTEQDKAKLVTEYDDRNKHLGLIQDWQKEGIKHYLDWFYTKWSKKLDVESINLYAAIKKTGFLP